MAVVELNGNFAVGDYGSEPIWGLNHAKPHFHEGRQSNGIRVERALLTCIRSLFGMTLSSVSSPEGDTGLLVTETKNKECLF